MNTGLMSSVFGGKAKEIMALNTDQTEIIIGSLID
jgi:hypothetical protein